MLCQCPSIISYREFSRTPLHWRGAKVRDTQAQIRVHADRRSSSTLRETDHMFLASYTCSHLWPLPLYFLVWLSFQLPIKRWQF